MIGTCTMMFHEILLIKYQEPICVILLQSRETLWLFFEMKYIFLTWPEILLLQLVIAIIAFKDD